METAHLYQSLTFLAYATGAIVILVGGMLFKVLFDLSKLTQNINETTEIVKDEITGREKVVLNEISDGLTIIQAQQQSEKDIETLIYDIGKKHYGQEKLKDYFKMLYETMLGQQEGPRMGTFIAVYGIDKTKSLINKTIRDNSNNESKIYLILTSLL